MPHMPVMLVAGSTTIARETALRIRRYRSRTRRCGVVEVGNSVATMPVVGRMIDLLGGLSNDGVCASCWGPVLRLGLEVDPVPQAMYAIASGRAGRAKMDM